MKIGAIDIGSNAARLLIAEISKEGKKEIVFGKLNFLRIPLRLGLDVFETGKIGPERLEMTLQAVRIFKGLLDYYQVDATRCCATSAMRDAQNSGEVIAEIQAKTGLQIEVISGDEEATLIQKSYNSAATARENLLFIDVGGGSTELSLFKKGKLKFSHSFDVGTVRQLQGKVLPESRTELEKAAKAFLRDQKELQTIGLGGTIAKVFSFSGKSTDKPISLSFLKKIKKEISPLSLEERMQRYSIREDRADVLIPALDIFIDIMKWGNITKIFVPRISLADGIIYDLFEKINSAPQKPKKDK